ncbi:uncharacterized protein LOC116263305 isoform X2 [Nymphaea colorata]|uniref:uncharacterized protein LOC116263305 isoform X2 n=1 Tax=Nymphaea colorata TaxID=210225 RepID=UPI00129D471F|nr:uncharacterized protein LOC116263305 isoform X2 [Nymphaea colorata]
MLRAPPLKGWVAEIRTAAASSASSRASRSPANKRNPRSQAVLLFSLLPPPLPSLPCSQNSFDNQLSFRRPSMESMTVNWDALDSLVIDYAESENLLSGGPSPPPPPFSSSPSSSSCSSSSSASSLISSYSSRLVIYRIRRAIEVGDIDGALGLLQIHAPAVLEDHRLLFRLQKQRFIELLRKGSPEERDSAIKCLRTSLAPCALHAYPEAYEEFKHVLLAFIYDKDDHSSPVVNEWSEKRRFDLAASLSSVLRDQLQAYDPLFSMTLRYLVSIHKEFCYRQGVVSPVSDVIEHLLVKERDPPATPQEGLCEAPLYDEVDIQALAHAVQLTRQGAVDSLRYAKGDMFRAFQNELCRMRLDVPMLDKLVYEYCVYQGLLDFDGISVSGLNTNDYCQTMKTLLPDFESNPQKEDSSLNMDCGMGYLDGEISANGFHQEDMPETNSSLSTRDADSELRLVDEIMDDQEDCSTSEPHQTGNHPRKVSAGWRGSRERIRLKRWKGRVERQEGALASGDGKIYTDPARLKALKDEEVDTKDAGIEGLKIKDLNKYELILGIKELTKMGMTTKVFEEVNLLDPHFFEQNPVLLFQLKQVEFLKLVESGEHSDALRVACSYLGPIAANNAALLKPLKETLLTLLRPMAEIQAKPISLSALATSFQDAIGRNLGIEEPQLMKVVRATLFTHDAWFKLQMCNDRFEGFLKIDHLKNNDTPLFADPDSRSTHNSCSYGSSQGTISSSNKRHMENGDQSQGLSRDIVCEETAILKVMEFLALPRADAIQLLAQYNGSAESVIEQIFA